MSNNNEKLPRNFSPALIATCQDVIRKQTGEEISEDLADIYLDKFVHLMKVTIKIMDYTEAKKLKNKSHEKNHSN